MAAASSAFGLPLIHKAYSRDADSFGVPFQVETLAARGTKLYIKR
jgi:hypothetical protein